MTGWEFFTRFPALYPFLLSQLRDAASSVEGDAGHVKLHPSLFLLLLVLGRLYPSPMDGSSSPMSLAAFRPFIIRCSRSAVYRTREMAARALVPFVLVTNIPTTVKTLIEELPVEPGAGIQQNHVHGTILQVLFLLRSYLVDNHRPQTPGEDQNNDLIKAFMAKLWLASRQNPCLVTRSTMLDVLIDLCTSPFVPVKDSSINKLRSEMLTILVDSELLAPHGPEEVQLSSPGSTQYLHSLGHLAASIAIVFPILWGMQEDEGRVKNLVRHLLQCPHYEVRQVALDQLLQTLKKHQECQEQHFHFCVHDLTYLALHEPHPACLTKVLQVLTVLPLSLFLPWQDGCVFLTDEEALDHLLSVAESSIHSLELHCAALCLASRMMVHLANKTPSELGGTALASSARWVALLTQCCSEEQPAKFKQMAAEVMVKVTPAFLTSTNVLIGISNTLSLWHSLFTLLQDEDQDVRDRAADFICHVPTHLTDMESATGSVSPPVAVQMGMGILCQLLQVWGQVAIGIITLIEWLLSDDHAEVGTKETLDLDEDFLFEKGDLNLWAEPLHWAQLLHKHLCTLSVLPCTPAPCPEELGRLFAIANNKVSLAQQALSSLPPLPQFSATIEHAKLTVLMERATLAQKILGMLTNNCI